LSVEEEIERRTAKSTTNADFRKDASNHVDAPQVKHRKQQRGRRAATPRCVELAFGDFGIQPRTRWITARQIEAARIAMTVT